MDILKTFINQFTEEFDFNKVTKINKKYFFIEDNLKKLNESIDEDDLRSSGLFLGEEKSKKFIASINILNILKDKTDRTIQLNNQASWLFICGRDVFLDSVVKEGKAFSNVLVLNYHNEVIGLARRDKKDKTIFTNLYDIGHMLRREQKSKK